MPHGGGDEQALIHAGIAFYPLERARKAAARWGVPLGEAALAIGALRPRSYTRALASMHGLTAVDDIALRKVHPAPEPHALLANRALTPLAAPRGGLAVNAEAMTSDAMAALAAKLSELGRDLVHRTKRRHPPEPRQIGAKPRADASADESYQRLSALVPVSRKALAAALAQTYGDELAARAANGLRRRAPHLSAATGLTRWQAAAVAVIAGLFIGGAVFAPREALVVYGAGLSLVFLLTILLRTAAASHASLRHLAGTKRRYRRLRDADLPRYTVLVAMFKEARVLPDLVAALRGLDYPAPKLEVMLVLEAVDAETIAAARALPLPPNFDVVIVPDGAPRTKPRALNYALQFARGEFTVIFDAEDRPDPNQLRKAAAHFREASPDVVCLQGKLTYDNCDENWLARQFSIEYASLFDGILPMLDRARLPLPLGGTSNHFRTGVLRRLGGWDPHNVTEDADLGMRIYRSGHRAEVLDSVTYEEAACHLGNWIRQRTRWLKGWMQTYGVHMRQPTRLFRDLGPAGFLAFQGHFAGIVIAALIHPWSYVLVAHDLARGVLFAGAGSPVGGAVLYVALFNLAAGYAASLVLGWFTVRRFRRGALRAHLIFIPAYWLLVSVAAYRALFQLVTCPHYWEKTEHGLTKVRRGK
jgi:cellulose synthase/poly-beta-1,6-N-acetylglucosamine synthase-like glycosyltransferase